ncbi:MAG: PilZ domain-containing protein [Nitrospirota bacterium]|nr:PilZ domain-containing protein [Nitrospirota bacterium]
MDTQDERREYKRYPFVAHVLIDGMKLCPSSDISEGGLFVSAIQHFQENDIVDVTIPHKEKTVMLKARVRYYQFGIGMGLMFSDLNDTQRAQITELIESIAVSS